MLDVVGWICLAVLAAWSLQDWRAQSPSRIDLGWRWWLLTGVVLFCFRLDLVVATTDFNPDEALLLAGAITLKHDLVCWRSVDGMTAGPLVFYSLLPAALGHGLSSFILARITALACELAMLFFVGEALAKIAGPPVARLAGLPALAFLAFTTTPDFTFYSTEIAPLFLLSGAVWFGARQVLSFSRMNLWLAGILLGAAPWAKLQITPIAALLWLLLVYYETASKRPRAVVLLIGAGLAPSLAFALMAAITGQTDQIIIPYFLNSIVYINAGNSSAKDVFLQHVTNALGDGYLALWVAGTGIFAGISLWCLRTAPKRHRVIIYSATALVLVSVACVIAPLRDYTHYLHLLELPLIVIAGAILSTLTKTCSSRAVRLLSAGFLACTFLPQVGRKLTNPPIYSAHQWTSAATRKHLLETVQHYAARNEGLAIWGWYPTLYVDSGMYQATRDGQTQPQINPGRWRAFFRSRYMQDLTASNAAVFVDSVGPGNIIGDRRYAHESFPALDQWIDQHYSLVQEFSGFRIYIRNDRFEAARPLPPSDKDPSPPIG